ncbi:type I methionyl aminopeptidase [candidate division KSB1 bacterium]|nr:type I methionyl aminopeptidase [candidate division KSB1 bacterium]
MIAIRNAREIELIRQSCQMVADALDLAEQMIKPGVRIIDIDKAVEDLIRSRNARPAFKGFRGFPASICASVDDQVVHGIPDERTLQEGQIISIDIGVEQNNYFGDAARTYAVGEIDEDKARLMLVTKESLLKGIEQAKKGNRLSDISHAVQKHVEKAGFSVVRELVGHGIGEELHEEPQIPNYGRPNRGPRLKIGMVLAIEPMVNMGGYQVETADDKWTVLTMDGLPSAHFEHTIVITERGPEILSINK